MCALKRACVLCWFKGGHLDQTHSTFFCPFYDYLRQNPATPHQVETYAEFRESLRYLRPQLACPHCHIPAGSHLTITASDLGCLCYFGYIVIPTIFCMWHFQPAFIEHAVESAYRTNQEGTDYDRFKSWLVGVSVGEPKQTNMFHLFEQFLHYWFFLHFPDTTRM